MATECGVCFELYEIEDETKCPKLLPFVPTFCVACLTRLEENSAIKCPICRIVHLIPNGGVQNFPTNQLILIQFPETGDNGSQNDSSDSDSYASAQEEVNNDVRIDVNLELVLLLPGNQATRTRDHSKFKKFLKYFSLVVCFPFWFSFLIVMFLVAIVIGFILALCYQIYVDVTTCHMAEDTMQFVELFVESFFDIMASLLEHCCCLCGVDDGNSVIPGVCRKLSKVVSAVVTVLNYLLTIVLCIIIIICSVILAVVYFIFFVLLCGRIE